MAQGASCARLHDDAGILRRAQTRRARRAGVGVKENQQRLHEPPLIHEQTTVRKPDHCAAGAGSTGQSKQRAGSGAGWLRAGRRVPRGRRAALKPQSRRPPRRKRCARDTRSTRQIIVYKRRHGQKYTPTEIPMRRNKPDPSLQTDSESLPQVLSNKCTLSQTCSPSEPQSSAGAVGQCTPSPFGPSPHRGSSQ